MRAFHGRRLRQRGQCRRGHAAWEQAGLPVVRGKKAISLERQVRIAAGSLVVIGSVLGASSSGCIGLAAFVGAGLVFAGVTGYLRHGDDPGPDAVEPGRAGGCDVASMTSGALLLADSSMREWRASSRPGPALRGGRGVFAGADGRRRVDLRGAAAGLRPGGSTREAIGVSLAAVGATALVGGSGGCAGRGRGRDGPAVRHRRDARALRSARGWGVGFPGILLLLVRRAHGARGRPDVGRASTPTRGGPRGAGVRRSDPTTSGARPAAVIPSGQLRMTSRCSPCWWSPGC